MKVLLITPPMSNLTTPYPATAFLTGHLRSKGLTVEQVDWSLALALRLFSREGLDGLHSWMMARRLSTPEGQLRYFSTNLVRYRETIEPVIRYLQGKDPGLAERLLDGNDLPCGPYLHQLYSPNPKCSWVPKQFGALRGDERARIIATYYLEDLAHVVRCVCPGFTLQSYRTVETRTFAFDQLLPTLNEGGSHFLVPFIDELVRVGIEEQRPDLVGLSVPFTGALLGAFMVARAIKRISPETKIVMGGGFPSCCMRQLSDPRPFDYVDFIALDDGARPLECIVEYLSGDRGEEELLRTFRRREGRVVYISLPGEKDHRLAELSRPTYDGLPLDRYLSLLPYPNPAKRMWSRRWNKLMLAHGCYWGKCSFCDTGLDYVKRYEPQSVSRVVRQIKEMTEETGLAGVHFVDEAAPPSMLRGLAERLIEEDMSVEWWGNIRFEKAFTPELVSLLARSGCVMVSGGLEAASDRLLKKINKGVHVAQAVRVAGVFKEHGVAVHTYLMYGLPTQTIQETIDSLEIVRQCFAAGIVDSAFWHRFLVTEHSLIRQDPEAFGIRLTNGENGDRRTFSLCERSFEDPTGVDHEALGRGLEESRWAYEEGRGLERDVEEWFDFPVPKTIVARDYVSSILNGS